MYTEFISSEGLIRDAAKSRMKLDIFEYERPIGVQIFGSDTETMVKCAEIIEATNPDLLDINYGCPVSKVTCKGAGAGILKDIPKMVSMTEAIVKATKLPVTVKTRLGWDEESKNVVEVAERLQDMYTGAYRSWQNARADVQGRSRLDVDSEDQGEPTHAYSFVRQR
jgi:tRNA-dihydrouridine synthase